MAGEAHLTRRWPGHPKHRRDNTKKRALTTKVSARLHNARQSPEA